ncbi:hypothetical protein AXF42_Ash015043 [Apostasia shenzhenica]|uniref:VWFA domain-containing protein n=1 Tax=Apostasia shenzhenica TaxID=1088818 RepID=A0A2I0B2Z7_9ASPA|nr:hypothetical protein AXF42_Ash015043 [Apostasia shenzhenica]
MALPSPAMGRSYLFCIPSENLCAGQRNRTLTAKHSQLSSSTSIPIPSLSFGLSRFLANFSLRLSPFFLATSPLISLEDLILIAGMEDEFTRAVEDGLKLAKRVYAGKERHTVAAPRQPVGMEKSAISLLPTAPMVYAVIGDPSIVDNPDVPSYQPHVHGRCDPPALIPLQMKDIAMEVDCYLDTAFVLVSGRWRVHCVMGSRRCDCLLVVPMGEQVDGGCDIFLKITWSQKLIYTDGHFLIRIPFNFPEYVTPFTKIVAKREKIQLNVNSGTEKEVIIQKTTHPLKEKSRNVGRFSFFYEANVENWSAKDFEFSYSVLSGVPYGGILLKYPSRHDHDQRNLFFLYLYPGAGGNQISKVFRKKVVFLVDISGSMQGKPLDSVKSALRSVLSDLAPADYFNVITFNEDMYCFSSSLEPANEEMIENATQWVSKNFIAYGGTNIMQPINKASHMLEKNSFQATGLLFDTDYVPYIFLITDGAAEDERAICHAARTIIQNRGYISPRICTFGIADIQIYLKSRFQHHRDESRRSKADDVEADEQKAMRGIRKCVNEATMETGFPSVSETKVVRALAVRHSVHSQCSRMRAGATREGIGGGMNMPASKVERGRRSGSTRTRSIDRPNCGTCAIHTDLHEQQWCRGRADCKVGSLKAGLLGVGSHKQYFAILTGSRRVEPEVRALFPVVTNIAVDAFDKLDAYEVYPCNIPDLLAECPLILSGRYEGKFPRTVKIEGRLADMSSVVLDLNVENMGDIPPEKVCAKQHIDLLTAQAWLSESKQLEEKVSKLSIWSGIPSEFTYMILLENEVGKQDAMRQKHDKKRQHNAKRQTSTLVHFPTLSFGNLSATAENLPPCCGEPKQADATFALLEKAVSCCGGLCDRCCCMCCIQVCSKMNDQCVIALTQLCTALACFGCSECCIQLCCDGD